MYQVLDLTTATQFKLSDIITSHYKNTPIQIY